MNYPIDREAWKELVSYYAHKIEDLLPPKDSEQSPDSICLVFNLEEEHDEVYGAGPTCMAFAKYNHDTQKFMSVAYPKDEISYYDFRDVCNHNVGYHSGKITHWLDDYDLTCLLMALLVENRALKNRALNGNSNRM